MNSYCRVVTNHSLSGENSLNNTLHLTNGDSAGEILSQSSILGEVFVWHDILYDGSRKPGWPDNNSLNTRALFLENETAGGLGRKHILYSLKNQYRKLATAADFERIVLWFDACLFDQAMLVHILTCLFYQGIRQAELLCIDNYPGIEPFHGLGQLNPSQLASLYDQRRPVTDAQFQFARLSDRAFATQDATLLAELSCKDDAALPWIPAAVRRWLQEWPDTKTGLGRLECLAFEAICNGCETLRDIFSTVSEAETPPQFWGDTTLWAKINALANRNPPLVRIEGPAARLPQWESTLDLREFRIKPQQ